MHQEQQREIKRLRDIVTPQSPRAPDPADVAEAKVRLASFVVNTLEPATASIQDTLRLAAHVIGDWDRNSPQSEFAWNGIANRMPPPISMNSMDSLRDVPLIDIERAVEKCIINYRIAANHINLVIVRTSIDPARQNARNFIPQFCSWYILHEKLKKDLSEISEDIHFPVLRSQSKHGVFNLNQYPESVFSEFYHKYS